MCLSNPSEDELLKALTRAAYEGKEWFWGWKIIRESLSRRICRVSYTSLVMHYPWKVGINKAKGIKSSKEYGFWNSAGIYVYLSEPHNPIPLYYHKIRVKCYYKHLIAINSQQVTNRIAVLTQVTLLKRDFPRKR